MMSIPDRLIQCYQRYISPLKGFRCGYSVLCSSCSCSQYARKAFAQHGWALGWRLARDRMRRCGQTVAMAKIKKGHIRVSNQKRKRKDKEPDYCDMPFYACDCAGAAADSSSTVNKGCKSGFGPCDIDGADIACELGSCWP